MALLKGPLLLYTNHINNERPVHHGFQAPQAYRCSTSLIITHGTLYLKFVPYLQHIFLEDSV